MGNGPSSSSEAIHVASKLSLFLAELKRRKVTRVAVVYAVVGIGVIEGAQLLFEALALPLMRNLKTHKKQVLTMIILKEFHPGCDGCLAFLLLLKILLNT